MQYIPDNPIVVQSDLTVLVEALSPRYAEARDALLPFAELIKSPEYMHTWRITNLTLWNAAASGHDAGEVLATLTRLSKYPVPDSVGPTITDRMGRYGRLRLTRDGEWLRLEADNPEDIEEVRRLAPVEDLLGEPVTNTSLRIHPRRRGELKQVLVSCGRPVQDLAGFTDGDALDMSLNTTLPDGTPWSLREYQVEAIDAFHGGPTAGCGVVVLPCGAGKTLVGIGAMVRLGMRTLIICTGTTALRQWKREILTRTGLTEDQVGEFTAEIKQLRPVTLTTYQLLTWRRQKGAVPAHFGLFSQANWGLVIYDEVHLLPAPIFREAAGLQARRRLGLTATLVREDGREGDVFALIGPRRFDLPWKTLEAQGWIASASCVEVRVPLSAADRERYVRAGARQKFTIAAKNARKVAVVESLIARHPGEPTLILGTWIDQLEWIARRLRIPLISGKTPSAERLEIYARFRAGEIPVLALSKVGNFAIDLPSASVAIEIAGTWGSRQEEAQRLGRILRAKSGANQAWFYTVITADSREQEIAEHRQLFLAEQGYPYRIEAIS
ncbi:MAG: DNA excision repair protein ERCC-3 [Myxococcota bacterium]|jgi:DNA excision repair protein ERCC-3